LYKNIKVKQLNLMEILLI